MKNLTRRDFIKRGARVGAQCAACHGLQGSGDAECGYPALSGQPLGYLQLQSVLFKEDKRKLEDATAAGTKKKMMKLSATMTSPIWQLILRA